MMMNKKLSSINHLIGNNLQEMIYNLNKEFYSKFMKKQSRSLFKGLFIFFNMNKEFKGVTLPYPERFMHLCSIDDQDNFPIFPCNNDIGYALCKNKCNHTRALSPFQYIGRTECPYRMARIHWIPEIINLYNEENIYIKNWRKPIRNTITNRIEHIEFLRYDDGQNDYVVLLKEDVNKAGQVEKYSFMTAYPVFLKRNKEDFDHQYMEQTKLQKK